MTTQHTSSEGSPPKRYDVSLDELQVGLLISALYESLFENERYLASTPKHKTPRPEESCCPMHLARYEAGREQRSALKRVRRSLREALSTLQSVEASSWSNTVPREVAGVLQDREDADSVAAARWLAKHENDDAVWDILGRAVDELTELAKSDGGGEDDTEPTEGTSVGTEAGDVTS